MTSTTNARRLAVETALDIDVEAFRPVTIDPTRGFWLIGTLDDTRLQIHYYTGLNHTYLSIEVHDDDQWVTVKDEYVHDPTAYARLMPERLRDNQTLTSIISMYATAAAEITGRVDNYIAEITEDIIEESIIEFETKGVRA